MLNSKSNVRNIGDILGKIPSSFTFQDPPLIDVPYTTILQLNGNARQIPDPSKTLRPVLGIERIPFNALIPVTNERGPNGETVYKISNSDDRVRFVGHTWRMFTNQNATRPITSGNTTDFIEIVFYGTGLNLLWIGQSGTPDIRLTVDNGVEGVSSIVPAFSTVLGDRQHDANIVIPIVSGLSLGTHTIRLRDDNGSFFETTGIEILNQATQIKIPQGEIFSNGLKYTNSTLQSIDYNAGFDGNPVLNGRGGRVVEYITPQGRIGKVIQQVDAASAFGVAANHSNEKLIKKINFREFGANRSDDWSTLTTVRGSAFTLDDGTTTLVGDAVVGQTINSIDSFFINNTGNFFTITFIGTGLDFFQTQSSVGRDLAVSIDGVSAGTISAAQLLDRRIIKVVSGLPYGTHTVRFTQQAGGTGPCFSDFLIYGPKKPTIPSGAIEIQEYNLMGNFSANTIQGINNISSGVMRKIAVREMLYNGTFSAEAVNPTGSVAGIRTIGTAAANTVRYTFFGTGFDLRISTPVAVNTFTISVDGSTNLSSFTTSFYGQFSSFVAATGVATSNGSGQFNNGLVVSGMPLGLHTVVLTQNAASSFGFESLDIITPIHYPNTQVGSLSVGPSVQLKASEEIAGVDLSKAKAWAVFDGSTQILRGSFNIAGVLRISTGQYLVYFEKPFSDSNYSVLVSGENIDTAMQVVDRKPNYCYITQFLSDTNTYTDAIPFNLVAFGKLENE